MNKYGFIIGIIIGIVLIVAILNPKMLYRECSDLFDYYSKDDIITIVSDKMLTPAIDLLFENWHWKPFRSQPANIAIGALHAIAIGIVFPAVIIGFLLYALFFFISFFIGTILGAVAGALASPFVYLFCSQRHIPGPELPKLISQVYIGGGVLFVYITHALLAGILFGWVSSLAKAELIYGPRKAIEGKKDEKIDSIDRIKEQILAIKKTEDELRKTYKGDPETADEIVKIFKRSLVEQKVIGDVDDDL